MKPLISKRKAAVATLLLPEEEAWSLWLRQSDGSWQQQNIQKTAKTTSTGNSLLGIPVMALCSSPFTARLPDEEPSAYPSPWDAIVDLRWTALGMDMPVSGSARHSISWQIISQDRIALVGTMILANPSFQWPSEYRLPAHFTPSPLLYPMPENGIVVYKELGRYVVLFRLNGHLFHAAILCSPFLDEAAAEEIITLQQILSIHWDNTASAQEILI